MSRYISTPTYPNATAVDISFVFADEKPADRHGFICADGDDLRFEGGILSFEIGDEPNPTCQCLILKE